MKCAYITLILVVLVSTTPAQMDSAGYLTGPFDAKIKKLPKGFRGHSFSELRYVLVDKIKSFKDQFETTGAYQKRVAAGIALTNESQFAVFLENWTGLKTQFSYDADSQKAVLNLNLTKPLREGQVPSLSIASDLIEDPRTGATKFFIRALSVSNSKFIRPVTFAAEPTLAKSLKNAKVLVLFHLNEPYDRSHNVGGQLFYTTIGSTIDDIWWVNPETGEVYTKLSLQQP